MVAWRSALLATASVAASATTHDTVRACSCDEPPTFVLPSLSAPAPIDTHVWLRGPTLLMQELFDDHYKPIGKTDRVVEVRTAALPNTRSAPVGGTTRIFGGAAMPTLEFIPKSELAPRTLYEVWLVDRSPLRQTVLAGAFRTGARRDEKPPTWDGLKSGVADDPMWPHKFLSLAGECGESLHVNLSGTPAKDEGPVLYAVWVAPPSGAIDYGAPPSAYLRENDAAYALGALLSLGQLACWPLEVDLPKANAVRIGAAAVNLAGRRSPTSEVTVSLLRPAGTHAP